MKKIFITLLLLISFNSLSSQDNYKSLLIDYMTAQGQFETFNATIDQMGSMMGVTIKESDKEEFTKDVMGSLIDLLVPVYKKHFSEQDLFHIFTFPSKQLRIVHMFLPQMVRLIA